MPELTANGTKIYYERFGSENDPPVLFVSGLGSQIVYWRPGFVDPIVDAGFQVILFENRDSGYSQHFDDARVSVMRVVEAIAAGEKPDVPYLLSEMADDAVGLLDALGIEHAHILGVSMGGYIAQVAAARHPDRILTLTSIMSSTGNPEVGRATPEMTEALFTAPPTERQAAIQSTVDYARLAWGDYFDEARARETAARNLDRVVYPEGTGRQLAAILATGDRTADLKGITVPALVIHGEKDPLIDPSGGIATADAIPDAELWIVPGMGHDLPPELDPELTGRIVEHFGSS
ncbi:MAG: alpha/beta hydrolase [Acidimicrobiia bacterium]